MHINSLSTPGGGFRLFHGLGHGGKDGHLLVHQDVPISLPLRRSYVNNTPIGAMNDDVLLPLVVWIVRRRCTHGLTIAHAKFVSSLTEGEDGQHMNMNVVLDELVEMPSFLGLMLRLKYSVISQSFRFCEGRN